MDSSASTGLPAKGMAVIMTAVQNLMFVSLSLGG